MASMWPWAEAHGNIRRGGKEGRVSQLQCGRGPKPTEIGMDAAVVWNTIPLQCGRGPKPTEMAGADFGAAGRQSMLQCGRGPKPTEIAGRVPAGVHRFVASMWPWAEAHGNDVRICILQTHEHGFNVAVGRSPRKSTRQCLTASAPTRFNVAVGRSPRKLLTIITNGRWYIASMWPWAEAHGNLSTPFSFCPVMRLQCGRGPKPTEIRMQHRLESRYRQASMWPWAEAHGNPHLAIRSGLL